MLKSAPLFLFVALAGCVSPKGIVSTRSISYESTPREARAPDSPVEIIDSANLTRPYKVIGIVQANAGKLHNTADTMEALKNEARKLGADALTELQEGPLPVGVVESVGSAAVFSGGIREQWTAKAIIWTDFPN